MKEKNKLTLGLLISVLSILLIIVFVDLKAVWKNLQKLSWHTAVFISSLYLINMLFRAIRWRNIIRTNRKVDIQFMLVFKALIYGYALNQLLPLKIGEVGRAEYLTRRNKESRSLLLGTIVVERIFDVIIIIIFLGFSILFSDTVMSSFRSNVASVIIMIISFTGAVILFINLQFLKKITGCFPDKIEVFLNKIIDNIVHPLAIFNSSWRVVSVLLISLVIWSLTCFSFALIITDIGIEIPFYAYFFIVSAGTFGMIIPSTSANVGVYHAVSMGALMIFMVPKEQALSFAILAHAFDFFPSIVLGGILFGYGRLLNLKNIPSLEKDIAKH